MQKEVTLKNLNLWKGEFADNFKNRPRLYKALTENQVYFEGDDEKLTVTFHVENDIQQHWIETVVFDELAEKFLSLSGVKLLELLILVDMEVLLSLFPPLFLVRYNIRL